MNDNKVKGGKLDKDAQALNAANRKYVKGKGKGGRRGSKNFRRDKEIADTATKAMESTISKTNDFSWYAKFPNYIKDVGTIAFGTPVGQPIYVQGQDYVVNDGIMTLYFTPSPGISTDLTSPINRQATRFYTYLRSVQRAAATYDAADVMMYLMGIDSLYTYWAFMRRIYGVAQLFTPTNTYYPRRLLAAMGVDPAIAHNLADFRAYLNRYALNIGRFSMPKDFDINVRHMWMASGLYLDSDTTRAQTYMFVPAYLWKWNNTVETGSQLDFLNIVDVGNVSSGTNRMGLSELITLGDTLINNFENDEDSMMISGDLFRAYGDAKLLHVEETKEGYAVLPAYDKVVLSQIENCTIVGAPTSNGFSITQNPSVNNGAIIFQPKMLLGNNLNIGDETTPVYGRNYIAIATNTPINAHIDSPTAQDVVEMTRLTARVASNTSYAVGAKLQYVALTQTGTDIIHYVQIVTGGRTDPLATSILTLYSNTIWIDETGVPVSPNGASIIAHFMQFDWAPMLYLVKSAKGSSVNLESVAADVDNFTTINENQMFNIHEAVLLSVLDVPEINKV